jgi:acyl-coenzyme A thioesterase PaaI-like protein
MASVAQPPALFTPAGDGFRAAPLTRGPWDERMMHGGAPSALLAHAIETTEPGAELAVARLTIEFLGGVPVGPVEVATSLAKPGRRLQIVEATLAAGGRRACLARAVRLRRDEAEPDDAALPPPLRCAAPLPAPESGEPWLGLVERDDLFYPGATEIRLVGGATGSGHAIAWIRMRGELLPGVAPSPLVRACAAADFSNGLSAILPFEDWMYVNTDLTVQLHREPEGEWIGLDAQTVAGPAGIGQAGGVLHDRHGPVGTCTQVLFIERRA